MDCAFGVISKNAFLNQVHEDFLMFFPKRFVALDFTFIFERASLVAQRVKCLPAVQETRVRSLSREDPLEKEMATHSSTLAWRIPWMEEPGGEQSTGSHRVGLYLRSILN